MEEKQLYLKKVEDGFVFALEPFNTDIMSDDCFLFKEALVIIYPDGKMDAMRNGAGVHHNYYYKKLYESSKRFRDAVDNLNCTVDFDPDESTYPLDCRLSSLGISSLHNIDIHRIPFRIEELADFVALFYVFKTENSTSEVDSTLDIIYDNYPDMGIVKNVYNSASGRFDHVEKDNVRRV